MDASTQVWVDEIRTAALLVSTAACLDRNALMGKSARAVICRGAVDNLGMQRSAERLRAQLTVWH